MKKRFKRGCPRIKRKKWLNLWGVKFFLNALIKRQRETNRCMVYFDYWFRKFCHEQQMEKVEG